MRKSLRNGILLGCLTIASAAVAKPVQVGLTKKQMLSDFDQLTSMFQTYYAPLEYKDSALDLNIEQSIKELRAQLKSKNSPFNFGQILRKFATLFKDAHVAPRIFDQKYYTLPFTFEYAQGVFVVSDVYDQAMVDQGIVPGLVLKSIDGKSVDEIKNDFLPYFDVGNDLSNNRNMAQLLTFRRFNLPDAAHSFFEFVSPVLSRGNAVKTHTHDLYWEIKDSLPSFSEPNQALMSSLESGAVTKPQLAVAMETLAGKQRQTYARRMSALLAENPGSTRAELEQMMSIDDFDDHRPKYEATLVEHFQAMEVLPDKSCDFEVEGLDGPLPVPGYVFRYKQYMLGVVRIPDYTPELPGRSVHDTIHAYSESYRCLLQKLSKTTDGLIVDQTDNGGGYLEYMNRLSQLFIDGSGPGTAHYIPTDRKWQRQFAEAATASQVYSPGSYATNFYRSVYRRLVKAAEAGEKRIGPVALSGVFRTLKEDDAFTFLKPVVVAIDSLDASSADAFPEVMKRNGHLLFGERTMGAGGCVEVSDPLTYSQYGMSMTRSMFFGDSQNDEDVANENFIENNGVTPDVEYSLQASDLVSQVQYAQYVEAMAETAVAHIESQYQAAEEQASAQEQEEE